MGAARVITVRIELNASGSYTPANGASYPAARSATRSRSWRRWSSSISGAGKPTTSSATAPAGTSRACSVISPLGVVQGIDLEPDYTMEADRISRDGFDDGVGGQRNSVAP